MVICSRPVTEVCPVEWARMPNRSVLQWDKDDCADSDLVKFDLLGWNALRIAGHARADPAVLRGIGRPRQSSPNDPDTFAMLRAADTSGSSRSSRGPRWRTLPRLKPEIFYDLACEVALIPARPIQAARCTRISGGATAPKK